MSKLLIYGANGYSGRQIVEALCQRGQRPIVAGRNVREITALGKETGLESRCFDLADSASVARGLEGVKLVLHCAGPFSATAQPMLDACLRHGCHYLDITGEYAVFETVAARDAELRAAGIMAMSGVGMDVVPSDCLAAHLLRRMPDADRLVIYVRALEHLSRGTASTFAENMGLPNVVRENGRLVERVAGKDRCRITFPDGKRFTMVSLPWGDIATAWRTTGIPNISVYMSLMPGTPWLIRLAGLLRGLLQSDTMQSLFKRIIQRFIHGPDATYRAGHTAEFIAEASNPTGKRCRSHLETMEGYAFTAESASEIACRVLAGNAVPGYQTPGQLFGPDFVLEIKGSKRTDLD
jgi:short subunit dehydrogenase-like uncharacterized protein